jgi:hypothetical protein
VERNHAIDPQREQSQPAWQRPAVNESEHDLKDGTLLGSLLSGRAEEHGLEQPLRGNALGARPADRSHSPRSRHRTIEA